MCCRTYFKFSILVERGRVVKVVNAKNSAVARCILDAKMAECHRDMTYVVESCEKITRESAEGFYENGVYKSPTVRSTPFIAGTGEFCLPI